MPTGAFEMNYVFTDGEGATDNNQGKNYMTPVQGTMTSELWEEKAVERQVSPARDVVRNAQFTGVRHDLEIILVYTSSACKLAIRLRLVRELYVICHRLRLPHCSIMSAGNPYRPFAASRYSTPTCRWQQRRGGRLRRRWRGRRQRRSGAPQRMLRI